SRMRVSSLALLYYAVIFCTGAIRSFAGPAGNAIIAQLVPKDVLQFADNISSTSWLAASILGHATAGFLIALAGVHASYFVVLFYVLLAAYALKRIEPKPIVHNKANIRTWESVREGLSYVFRHKI